MEHISKIEAMINNAKKVLRDTSNDWKKNVMKNRISVLDWKLNQLKSSEE